MRSKIYKKKIGYREQNRHAECYSLSSWAFCTEWCGSSQAPAIHPVKSQRWTAQYTMSLPSGSAENSVLYQSVFVRTKLNAQCHMLSSKTLRPRTQASFCRSGWLFLVCVHKWWKNATFSQFPHDLVQSVYVLHKHGAFSLSQNVLWSYSSRN